MVNFDKYEEVINGKNTYRTIADFLLIKEPVIIGWTDEEYTHYDILFNLGCQKFGMLQRGLKQTDLYVSVMSIGSFGFKLDSEKHPGYVAEKLFHGKLDGSVEKLTELINGVINELKK